jgi:hypothetical protein
MLCAQSLKYGIHLTECAHLAECECSRRGRQFASDDMCDLETALALDEAEGLLADGACQTEAEVRALMRVGKQRGTTYRRPHHANECVSPSIDVCMLSH